MSRAYCIFSSQYRACPTGACQLMLPGSIRLIGMLLGRWKIRGWDFDICFGRRSYLGIDQSLLIEQNGLFLLKFDFDIIILLGTPGNRWPSTVACQPFPNYVLVLASAFRFPFQQKAQCWKQTMGQIHLIGEAPCCPSVKVIVRLNRGMPGPSVTPCLYSYLWIRKGSHLVKTSQQLCEVGRALIITHVVQMREWGLM